MKKAIAGLSDPKSLLWWQWGKLLGLVLPPLALLADSRFVLAVAMHVLCDFTLQNDWMAYNRGDNLLALAVHSLIAGAVPGYVAAGPGGAIVGFLTHLAIDGLGLSGISYVLDQVLHIAILALLVF